jgi:hypothetical protein
MVALELAMPSPNATPLTAVPRSELAEATCWLLSAVAGPPRALALALVDALCADVAPSTMPLEALAPFPDADALPVFEVVAPKALDPVALALALPELAPLAPSIVPALALVVLLPNWPVPRTAPLVFETVPDTDEELTFNEPRTALLLPLVTAAPVVTIGPEPLAMAVDVPPTPSPIAGPLAATPVSVLAAAIPCRLVAVASPEAAIAEAAVGPLVADALTNSPPPEMLWLTPPTDEALALPLLAPLAASTLPTTPVRLFAPD